MTKTLITMCARGGSKGIPGKNIKIINNKPLLAYTIEHAKKIKEIYNADIGFSTDSIEIKKTAKNLGITTQYKRRKELASDTAGKIETINDLILFEEQNNNTKYDFIIDLDITSPLRTVEDVQNAYKLLEKDKNALNVFSVSMAKKNPYFNIVEQKNNKYYSLVKSSKNVLSRQVAPKVYEMNASFYIYTRNFFDLGYKSAISDKSLIYEMKHICFDLDEPLDFIFMEFLLQNKLLDFEL